VHIIDGDKTSTQNMSTKGSDKKSKNAEHDTLSNNGALSFRKQTTNLRFNSSNPNETLLLGAPRRRADYSVESASAMNNRNLRDSNSHMRGSAKNL